MFNKDRCAYLRTEYFALVAMDRPQLQLVQPRSIYNTNKALVGGQGIAACDIDICKGSHNGAGNRNAMGPQGIKFFQAMERRTTHVQRQCTHAFIAHQKIDF